MPYKLAVIDSAENLITSKANRYLGKGFLVLKRIERQLDEKRPD